MFSIKDKHKAEVQNFLTKLNEINPSNEGTLVTQDFSTKTDNLYKISKELIRYNAGHQNKDNNPDLRQYNPDLSCCTHKNMRGVDYIQKKEEDTSAYDCLSSSIQAVCNAFQPRMRRWSVRVNVNRQITKSDCCSQSWVRKKGDIPGTGSHHL